MRGGSIPAGGTIGHVRVEVTDANTAEVPCLAYGELYAPGAQPLGE